MSYWEDRSLQIKANQLDNAKRYERELKQRFEPVEAEITELIAKFVKKYANAHGITVPEAQALIDKDEVKTWNETLDKWKSMADSPEYEFLYEKYMEGEFAKSRITRLQALRQQITDLLASYTSNEVQQFSDQLEQAYDDTYYQTTYSIQNGLGTYTADFQKLNPNLLKSVISQNWQGSNFSKRLWGNMVNTLPSYLEKSLFTGAALGYDSRQMVSQAKQVFRNMKNHELHRLIVTEMGHVDETATESAYKEQDVNQYRYLATLESRTCSICGSLDHQIFKVSEIERGRNYPLIHPNCRCTTTPYFEGMDDVMKGKRWSKNPYSGDKYDVDNMSFKDWKDWTKDVESLKMTKITTSNGIKITSVAYHLQDRMFERQVKSDGIINALEKPLFIKDVKMKSNGPSQEFIGKEARVYVNPETGVIITTIKTGTKIRRKYMKND